MDAGRPPPGGGQLLRVQRVALGGRHDGRYLLRPGTVRQQGRDQLGHLGVGQPAEPQPGDQRTALQLGQPPPRLAGQVVLA
jgi:hypothetical protein